MGSYVLISSCRNEGAFVDGLIDTVAAQTLPPIRWVIVDDGSNDDTYSKCATRAERLPFLEVIKMPMGRPRTFSSKVFALQEAFDRVRGSDFEFVGNLDADIRVSPAYYERLMSIMNADESLGLGGGEVVELPGVGVKGARKGSEEFHVPGGVQFFRRRCFEEIGGFIPVDAGGEDTIAEVMAMMRGWRVRTLPELEALHLRPEGVGAGDVFLRGMKWGRRFYLLGYHPLFYLCQCVRRLSWHPYIIGSSCRLLGFLAATAKGEKRPVSKEFVQFHRQMQMRRLRRVFSRATGFKRSG